MTQFFTTSDGIRLAFDIQGSGTPLLCLAGLTRNMADFDYVLPHLTGAQVIRMDYRGRGDSGWADPSTYTLLHEAQDALALLDHLGIARVAVLGTSRGGLIALVLGQLAKARLSGVAFNDIGPVIDRSGLERIAAYVGRRPASSTLAEHATRLERGSPGFANAPPDRWLHDAARQVRVTAEGLALSYDPALRDGFMAGLSAAPVDLWPFFDALAGLPLATIRGANSDLMSAATLAEMHQRRPEMIVATVPDRAHVPWLDEPESVAALQTFLKAVT